VVVRLGWIVLWIVVAAGPARAGTVSVGEPVPALDVDQWLPAEPEGDGPALLLFVGTWCAASRAVLDRLEPVAGDGVFELLAIAAEDGGRVRRFLDIGGWSTLTMGTDPDRSIRQAWFGDDGLPLPFAFVIGPDDEGTRRVLYADRAVLPHESEPLSTLLSTLAAVRDGTWDLDEAADEATRIAELRHRLDSWRGGYDFERFEGLVDELEQAELPVDLHPTVVERLNDIAWSIATTETRPRRLEVGVRAVDLALTCGGGTHAPLMDTHARLLWELDDQEAALARQLEAVALGRGTRREPALLEALEQYSGVLGVPIERESSAEPWAGVINQAFREHPMSAFVLVRPLPLDDAELEAAWAAEMADLHGSIYQAAAVQRPDEVGREACERAVLVLYGTPASNPLIAKVLEYHGIELVAEGVRLPDRLVEARAPFLIAALPSPWRPANPVLVYTAFAESDAVGLNAVFHGPTAVVIGRGMADVGPIGDEVAEVEVDEFGDVVDGGPPPPVPPTQRETALQADLRLAGEVVAGLDIGPAALTSAEAIADLLALHDLLRSDYAGYDDVAWALRTQESSWDERTEAFTARLSQQESWSYEEYFDLAVRYLAPVQDSHFRMDGTGVGAEGSIRRRAQLVDSLVPYFADGVVDAYGLSLQRLPGPDEARANVPYLFPTLPRDGHDPAWLIGVLADPDDPPRFIDVGTAEEPQRLEVHRAKVFKGPTERSWSVSRWPDTPLPVLAVGTMNRQRLDGLADSATELRDEQTVVLDLRDNGGGSDDPAREWVARFSHQWFRWGCGSSLNKGESDPLRRWQSWADSRFRAGGEGFPDEPYGGRLAVLADSAVASSGETFVLLASQVEGAVLLGENTSGCTAYGNVEAHDPLPHSRIELWFGRSRFVWECVRPVVEGVGIFPDYWLDEPAPVEWLSENPWP
jgi:hypothetical protein